MLDCHANMSVRADEGSVGARLPSWLSLLREREGMTVIRDAIVPAPSGVERIPAVVLHRRGCVIVDTSPASLIACLMEEGTAETPCMPVLMAHRRLALLRGYLSGRAGRYSGIDGFPVVLSLA